MFRVPRDSSELQCTEISYAFLGGNSFEVEREPSPPGVGRVAAAERRKRSATLAMRRDRSFSSLARWNEQGVSPWNEPGVSRARSSLCGPTSRSITWIGGCALC